MNLERGRLGDASGRTWRPARGDLNAQPHHGRLDDWYSASVDTAHNGSNHGAYRELDDRDRRCPGHGETTTSGTRPCSDHRTLIGTVRVSVG